MGIYDRDWWRDRYNERTGTPKKDAAWQRPEKEGKQAAKSAVYNPREFRADKTDSPRSDSKKRASPPDLPGANAHWTVQLLALSALGTVLLIAAKYLAPLFR